MVATCCCCPFPAPSQHTLIQLHLPFEVFRGNFGCWHARSNPLRRHPFPFWLCVQVRAQELRACYREARLNIESHRKALACTLLLPASGTVPPHKASLFTSPGPSLLCHPPPTTTTHTHTHRFVRRSCVPAIARPVATLKATRAALEATWTNCAACSPSRH